MSDQRLSTVEVLRMSLLNARDMAKASRLDIKTYSAAECTWFGLIEDEVNYALEALGKVDRIRATLF